MYIRCVNFRSDKWQNEISLTATGSKTSFYLSKDELFRSVCFVAFSFSICVDGLLHFRLRFDLIESVKSSICIHLNYISQIYSDEPKIFILLLESIDLNIPIGCVGIMLFQPQSVAMFVESMATPHKVQVLSGEFMYSYIALINETSYY